MNDRARVTHTTKTNKIHISKFNINICSTRKKNTYISSVRRHSAVFMYNKPTLFVVQLEIRLVVDVGVAVVHNLQEKSLNTC